jgi:hypothetical protein
MLRSLIFVVILASPAAAEQPKLAMSALQCNPAALCSGDGQRLRLDLQDQLEAGGAYADGLALAIESLPEALSDLLS